MPTKKREQSSANLYHVISRGNNKQWIFKTKEDKDKFLEILYSYVKDEIVLYTWCVMDNHVHIIIQIPFNQLSKIIGHMNTTYTTYYKTKYNHTGHVFQGRFLSEPINTEEYLLQVIKYIHNNPLKAKMINLLEEYEWSSYKWFLKRHSSRLTIDVMGSYFANCESKFLMFHQQESTVEIMDTKEEINQFRTEKGEKIISDFCQRNKSDDVRTIYENDKLMIDLIQELAFYSHLTNRQILNLTKFPYELIKKECKKTRNKK